MLDANPPELHPSGNRAQVVFATPEHLIGHNLKYCLHYILTQFRPTAWSMKLKRRSEELLTTSALSEYPIVFVCLF